MELGTGVVLTVFCVVGGDVAGLLSVDDLGWVEGAELVGLLSVDGGELELGLDSV